MIALCKVGWRLQDLAKARGLYGKISAMLRVPRLVIIFFVLLLAACSGPAPAASPAALTPTPLPPTPTLVPTLTPSPASPPTATAVSSTPTLAPPARTRYTLDLDFFYDQRAGRVEERIQYTNNTGETLTDLRLVAALYAYRDAFRLTGMWWLGGPLDGKAVENAVLENIQIAIPLPEPLLPGAAVGLRLAYEFYLPSQSAVGGERPLPIGYTARQANLVDWYPFIPPYRSGSGWLAFPPSYYGEHLVYDTADFAVNLRLPGSRPNLVVAASAPAEADGEWLRYRREGARTFAFSIGHEYASETARVGETTVTSYYFPLNEAAGKRALQTTVESLELFNELFGPYPHDSLAVVEADFYDGMEYDGLYFLSRAFYNVHTGDPGDYLVAIASHETAHQWWYGLVGNDQAHEPWLDEALCTYSERLYFERYYPEALDWWWQYRINYYKPDGWVDISVYNPQGELQTYQDYRNAVYLNGARFFEDLRKLAGEEAFFAFLKAYAGRYSGQIATGDDFFGLLSQYSQADLTPLLDRYFLNR